MFEAITEGLSALGSSGGGNLLSSLGGLFGGSKSGNGSATAEPSQININNNPDKDSNTAFMPYIIMGFVGLMMVVLLNRK